MAITRPERWVEIAQMLTEHGPLSVAEIAERMGVHAQPISHTCVSMERHGYLERLGKTPRRQKGKLRGSYIYGATTAGKALDVPPTQRGEPRARNNWSLRPFGAGKCLLAECLGLGRR